MKKILLSFALACLVLGHTYAQQGVHVGIEGAFNIVSILNQDAYGGTELDYTLTTGEAGGVTAGYNFDNHFGLQIEGLVSMQGQHYMQQDAGRPNTYRNVDLNYVHVPLMFKYCSGYQYPAAFYVMAGMQYSYLYKASLHYKDSMSDYTVDARNMYNKIDWAVVFEFGSCFKLYQGLGLSTGLRFNYGLTDINAPYWRTPNHDGIYKPSRNVLGGINIGLHYLLSSK